MTTMKTFTCAGVAPAMSPDVRPGHPGLRSLHAGCASPSMAPLASKAGSMAGATPRRFFPRWFQLVGQTLGVVVAHIQVLTVFSQHALSPGFKALNVPRGGVKK